ncbi:MAG: hypothetical protein A3K19_05890 [Lentisphaerae bacterium RIFOXYB12_FULL_65_16]|nr:MAG: hypothetical protein A3K18_15505 [Lentisphaerae bacterium RIFOXYA12_64_32]OGV95104.1 MAG: hypothetical protein A3K19_05890 [Lentisphaerae bacterium RIFOXYB12_FULL_65_16]
MRDTTPQMPGLGPDMELLCLLRPYVRHCGDSHRPAWKLARRRLLDYLLVYIAEGRGRFQVGPCVYDAEPNDLFWIPPDTDHEMEGFPPLMACPYVHFDLIYRPDVAHWDFSIPGGMTDLEELRPLMHPEMPAPRLQTLRGRIRTHTNRRAGDLIREICVEAARGQPYAGLRMSGLILQIVAEVLRGQEGLPTDCTEHIPVLEKAADYISSHCAEPLYMDAVARRFRLSPSYFRELFARHFGSSPRAYLRRARIRLAKHLMVGSTFDQSEIALRTGFSSVHSLSRAFRAEEGIPPSRYRSCGTARTRTEVRKTAYSH